MQCLVALSCLTLCVPMDCSPPASSVHGDSPGKNTGVGCHALLQEIFPTQGSNPGLLHWRRIFYQLSHPGSPRILEWVGNLSLLHSIFPIQESNRGLLHCRRILYQLCYQRSLRIKREDSINKNQNERGDVTTDTTQIQRTLGDYSEQRYINKLDNHEKIDKFLQMCNLIKN